MEVFEKYYYFNNKLLGLMTAEYLTELIGYRYEYAFIPSLKKDDKNSVEIDGYDEVIYMKSFSKEKTKSHENFIIKKHSKESKNSEYKIKTNVFIQNFINQDMRVGVLVNKFLNKLSDYRISRSLQNFTLEDADIFLKMYFETEIDYDINDYLTSNKDGKEYKNGK